MKTPNTTYFVWGVSFGRSHSDYVTLIVYVYSTVPTSGDNPSIYGSDSDWRDRKGSLRLNVRKGL